MLDHAKRRLHPHFPPGAAGKARYSDTNHQQLGGIIERLTGVDLRAAVDERIASPLALADIWLYDLSTDARIRSVSPLRKGTLALRAATL